MRFANGQCPGYVCVYRKHNQTHTPDACHLPCMSHMAGEKSGEGHEPFGIQDERPAGASLPMETDSKPSAEPSITWEQRVWKHQGPLGRFHEKERREVCHSHEPLWVHWVSRNHIWNARLTDSCVLLRLSLCIVVPKHWCWFQFPYNKLICILCDSTHLFHSYVYIKIFIGVMCVRYSQGVAGQKSRSSFYAASVLAPT